VTLLIGIYCEDGIVIAADQQATFGTVIRPTIGSPLTKISAIKGNSALFAFSGFTGLGQQIGDAIEGILNPAEPYFTQVPKIQPP
jgi:20S proteasome alpha/beta subunit